jgi:hypothetical protein
MHHSDVGGCGAVREALLQSLVRSQRGIEEEAMDRRKPAGQRIERLEPLRQQAQRAVGAANIAVSLRRLAQPNERREHGIARGGECGGNIRRCGAPLGLQVLVRRADTRHEFGELR